MKLDLEPQEDYALALLSGLRPYIKDYDIMFDYYAHVLEMNEEKLYSPEIKNLQKTRRTNPTKKKKFKSYLDMANSYNDRLLQELKQKTQY